eukprot:scaffold3549_cov110-Skeletonema_dohrnii-CCMP3373.AAC.13
MCRSGTNHAVKLLRNVEDVDNTIAPQSGEILLRGSGYMNDGRIFLGICEKMGHRSSSFLTDAV